LDCVGASFWEQNSEVLAVEGRWVIYGSLGGVTVNGDILGRIQRKRLSVLGSALRARSVEYKTQLVSSFTETALEKLGTGQLQTVVDRVFPFSDIAESHLYMESNANVGKIVVEIIPEAGKTEL